ncbi:hypothetical protein ZS55_000301 [Salmonella enterica subsp. salamae]|nr:hypothetical protein [Salmonella enterica subsp. salamae]
MIGCIFNYLHKTKPAVASSDKRNPRECEDVIAAAAPVAASSGLLP